jgi:hypothetical protein
LHARIHTQALPTCFVLHERALTFLRSHACFLSVVCPGTTQVLEIVGSNFGADAALAGIGGGISIQVGGKPCVPPPGALSVFVSDTRLRCVAPSSAVGAKAVSVAVAGQPAVMPTPVQVVALCGEGYRGNDGA